MSKEEIKQRIHSLEWDADYLYNDINRKQSELDKLEREIESLKNQLEEE